MGNGSIQQQVSVQYLQKFSLPIGVSGMQKLSEFPTLQQLGYNGQLGYMKVDFHGLSDFYDQMLQYSNANPPVLDGPWTLISPIVPLNINIIRKLIVTPSLGTVGQMFLTIENFAQIFSLSPSDLSTPATITEATSVYKNASTQSSVTTSNSSSLLV